MKQYESYKPSGVEFIGDIPEHWKVWKLKFSSKLHTGNSIANKENYIDSENSYPYIATKDIDRDSNKINYINGIYIKKDDDSFKVAQMNSTLLCVEGANAGKKLAFSDREICFGNKLCMIKSLDIDVYDKYVFYFVQSQVFKQNFFSSLNGMIGGVSINVIKNFEITIPTYVEQERISKFLDTKSQKIEEFVQEKQTQIALLQEQKEAIINQAVTKGLDDSVKMKDSGIEWIGDIPENWEVRKLQFLGQLQNGINIGAEYFGSGYPFVSYVDVNKNISLPTCVDGLVESSMSDRENYSVEKGDVLFTRTSETIEEIGFASTCLSSIENATFAGFLIRFRPYNNILNSNFSKYYFRSQLHRVFFTQEMNIVTRASLSQGLLKLLPTLLPPMDEQDKIAKYLDIELEKIDKVVSHIKKEIDLIKEYKTSLISEVVTGQIDVR